MSLPPVRTRIKICGLTREQDVDAAVAAGADAIGFVLYARSPRFVTPERAAQLARRLPPLVTPDRKACSPASSPRPPPRRYTPRRSTSAPQRVRFFEPVERL